ncbi:MAG: DNA primase [Tannerella sp.]|jgi:DNA primase|nr:DNA primase [Tannerella sp.]
MIDKLTIDKIFDAAHIVDVVSDFITLKKKGVSYLGLCPFHADKSPSMTVSPAKNIFKCFACGEGGNSVHFVMKHEKISYYEALRYLAKKYSIEVKEREQTDEEKRLSTERESMMIVNTWAQKFFASRLYEHQEGQTVGLPYFVERGFREDIIRKFQLGYSLNKRDDLYQEAVRQGYNEDYVIKTGLVYRRDDGVAADRFHGRVIFPVHTLSGKVVAFGGRILGKKDKVAKYVNSPESEIYHKSNELYGIFFAKQAMQKADKCFLVEGYTDVISMHQSGIENVVASSGTALTAGQIRLIHRFTNNITVLYDGDAAGIKAAIRGIDMLLEEGMNVKVVLLPEGEDPDSFARSHNSFDFNLFINVNEVDFIRFKTELLLKDAGDDPLRKARLVKEIMESIAVIPDNITRSVYIKDCSQRLDVKEQVLIDEDRKIRQRNTTRPHQPAANTATNPVESVNSVNSVNSVESIESVESVNSVESANSANSVNSVHPPLPTWKVSQKYEATLIRYIIRYGEKIVYEEPRKIRVAEYIAEELQNDDIVFQNQLYRRIFDEAVEHCAEEGFVASNYFLTHIDEDISKLATDMISNKYTVSKFFSDKTDNYVFEDEAQIRERERAKLERWVYHDILVLKNEYVKDDIAKLRKQLKDAQQDETQVVEILTKLIKLDRLKCKVGKELGERTITGLSK